MANLDPQDNIASSVVASFDRPIAVSVIAKMAKFPFLQLLGYNGQLGYMKLDFHGLQDFYDEMAIYSSTNPILRGAWAAIEKLVPLNLEIQKLLYTSPNLGTVGDVFKLLVGFDQTFAVNPDQLSASTGASVVSGGLAGAAVAGAAVVASSLANPSVTYSSTSSTTQPTGNPGTPPTGGDSGTDAGAEGDWTVNGS